MILRGLSNIVFFFLFFREWMCFRYASAVNKRDFFWIDLFRVKA